MFFIKVFSKQNETNYRETLQFKKYKIVFHRILLFRPLHVWVIIKLVSIEVVLEQRQSREFSPIQCTIQHHLKHDKFVIYYHNSSYDMHNSKPLNFQFATLINNKLLTVDSFETKQYIFFYPSIRLINNLLSMFGENIVFHLQGKYTSYLSLLIISFS